VGCAEGDEPASFVRFVLGPDSVVVADLLGRLGGRGAWVHPRLECLKKACTRGFAKSFRTHVATDLSAIGEQLVLSSARRVDGLLLAAARNRTLVQGRDAVREVAEKAVLLMLAEDARSVAKDAMVMALAQQGKVLVWGNKDHYGQLLGRQEVGILALMEPGIAEAVEKTVSMARLGTLARCEAGDARQLSEVR
jgi:uncharacterized protein